MSDDLNFIFAETEFILLDSGSRLLNEYLSNMQMETKDKNKRAVMIRELAKKKLKSTILDDVAISALIKEVNEFYNKKKEPVSNSTKSFKDLIYEDSSLPDNDLIRSNYIYNSSIIYVDSIKDVKNITNSVFKLHKINDDHSDHIFSNPVEKPKIFRNHYNLVKHFLLLNPEFKTKFQQNEEGIEISTLDCLLGNPNQIFVLGMLSFNEEGTVQLQDQTKIVSVDLSECDYGKGYFTQGCVVLIQGYFKNEVLRAKVMVHPKYKSTNLTFKDKYENDFFGAITKAFKGGNGNEMGDKYNPFEINSNNNIYSINANNMTSRPEESYLLNFLNKDLTNAKFLLPKTLENLIHINLDTLSKANYNSAIAERIFQTTNEHLSEEFLILISNPDLTSQSVLSAIDKIITGYNSNTNNTALPFMIVFIGNFTPENSYQSFKSYSSIFDNLANIILKNSQIAKHSYMVFVPGPDEFSLFSGLPKHPILETVINPLKKKLPNIINASNPCRFTIFGKEIVIFRDNLNKKISRNSIVKCGDIKRNKDLYVHTVLAQGNLSPLDLNVTSQIWHLSQCMNILPLPDFLILADVVEDFYMTNNKSTVVNPGNFTKDFSFNVIFPLKNLVEPCKINII